MKEELIKAIKENKVYDFVANNYLSLSKEELKRIALEFIYLSKDVEIDKDKLIDEFENSVEFA